ncbi:hypothetical protein [Methylovulum psychrotolerans]|uniref:Uncharacterized protein n=1 Tax=Methylovulum psychrotolerans TaxID=1704499 RepID=A0A1Z4C2X3_9GAMM|nr:hypothetical protein [Methylovulum psychrotolerans]ASF47855.1 hypothetical protein CEK71_18270 [Methylovulum psychrotolerans]
MIANNACQGLKSANFFAFPSRPLTKLQNGKLLQASATEAIFYRFRSQYKQIFAQPINIARITAKPFMVSASQQNANEARQTDKANLAQLLVLYQAVTDWDRQLLCYGLCLDQADLAGVNACQPPPKV